MGYNFPVFSKDFEIYRNRLLYFHSIEEFKIQPKLKFDLLLSFKSRNALYFEFII